MKRRITVPAGDLGIDPDLQRMDVGQVFTKMQKVRNAVTPSVTDFVPSPVSNTRLCCSHQKPPLVPPKALRPCNTATYTA